MTEKQIAAGTDVRFMQAKINTAHLYADHFLSNVGGLHDSIVEGADSVMALAMDSF